MSLQPTMITGTIVTGTIKSRKTNIGFAQVSVEGSGESAFTNDAGQFTITGVEPGKRTLRVTAQGYDRGVQQVTIAAPGDVQTVTISLQAAAYRS